MVKDNEKVKSGRFLMNVQQNYLNSMKEENLISKSTKITDSQVSASGLNQLHTTASCHMTFQKGT